MAIQEDPSQFRTSPALQPAASAVASPAYVDGGRAVDAARGWAWIVEGFGIFRRQAGMWVVLTIIFFLIVFALNVVPVIGPIAMLLAAPVLVGGIMEGCKAVDGGAELELAHLFAGFRRNTPQLMLLGVISFVLTLGAMIPVIVLMGTGIFAGGATGGVAGALVFSTTALLAGLIALALFVPVSMAQWFAPALIMFENRSAVNAAIHSFKGCLRNILAFLLFGIVVFALAILAAIPFMLGWLVLAPVVFASVYCGYRDIYVKR